MSKYAVMTECRDFRQQDWQRRDQIRQQKLKNAIFTLVIYIPVMSLIGGVLLLGYLPL